MLVGSGDREAGERQACPFGPLPAPGQGWTVVASLSGSGRGGAERTVTKASREGCTFSLFILLENHDKDS